MIPIRDSVKSQTFPIVNIIIIILNALFFLFELSLGKDLELFIANFAVVPSNYVIDGKIDAMLILIHPLPLLFSMFLHGGWLHFLGNMWYLWIFGDNVEDKLGHFRYIIFYLLCGIFASIAHIYFNIDSAVPTIGASGAIAGVMGAYVLFFPRGKILTMIPIFIFIEFIEVSAYFFLGFWILLQLFQGVFSMSSSANSGGVAWWAHIGGFAVGMLFGLLLKKRRIYYY